MTWEQFLSCPIPSSIGWMEITTLVIAALAMIAAYAVVYYTRFFYSQLVEIEKERQGREIKAEERKRIDGLKIHWKNRLRQVSNKGGSLQATGDSLAKHIVKNGLDKWLIVETYEELFYENKGLLGALVMISPTEFKNSLRDYNLGLWGDEDRILI